MILIEIGNTLAKAVRLNNSELVPLFKIPVGEPETIRQQMKEAEAGERVLLSSVRKDLSNIIHEQNERLKIHTIRWQTLGKITLDYDTPETLGIDRVLACAGAVEKTGKNVIVVDAGTACTVDYMTAGYEFKGGVIMPGLPVIRQSMKLILPELPEVDSTLPDNFPGKSTNQSIRFGLNAGYAGAIGSFIDRYRELAPESAVVFTGGDGRFVAQQLIRDGDATVIGNLVFDGMLCYLRLNQTEF